MFRSCIDGLEAKISGLNGLDVGIRTRTISFMGVALWSDWGRCDLPMQHAHAVATLRTMCRNRLLKYVKKIEQLNSLETESIFNYPPADSHGFPKIHGKLLLGHPFLSMLICRGVPDPNKHLCNHQWPRLGIAIGAATGDQVDSFLC